MKQFAVSIVLFKKLDETNISIQNELYVLAQYDKELALVSCSHMALTKHPGYEISIKTIVEIIQ